MYFIFDWFWDSKEAETQKQSQIYIFGKIKALQKVATTA